MLETKELTIRFGGHVAVDRVSCAFAPGTLTAIVGPNGAGKTTYFNLISGQLRASAGSVWFDGADITGETVPARTHRGLGRAFQLTQLFPNLSVVENVRLAVQSRRREGLDLFSVWLDRKETLARARALVAEVRLDGRADAAASSLPHGDQRKLEVAMLMALEPSVYMFDEPTGRHEHGRRAGDPRADPPPEERRDEDDPPRRAQDGRRSRARRPDHRPAQRPACRRRRARRGDRLAIVQQAYLGLAPEAEPA
jgi:ABC-type uncharacterized transport system ATPase subunit